MHKNKSEVSRITHEILHFFVTNISSNTSGGLTLSFGLKSIWTSSLYNVYWSL